MIVVNSSSVKPEDLPNVALKVLFSEDVIAGGKIKFGTVTVPPKARIPLIGWGSRTRRILNYCKRLDCNRYW